MKSLSILLLLFAASQAEWIKDYGPQNEETISQGGDLKLYCETDSNQNWDHCEFTHESNGKSCKVEWADSIVEQDVCSEKMTVGSCNRQRCEIVIKRVDIIEDAGEWTCTLTKEQIHHKKTFQVKLIQGPGKNPDQKPSHQVENTKETSTLMGVRSAILAFTFLITAVFVAGCLVLLPKNWPLLRDQCCSWK